MFGVYKSDCNANKTIIFVSILNSPRGGKVKEQWSTCDVLALSTIETTNCETTNRKSIQVPLTINELNRCKEEMDIEVKSGDIDRDYTDQESIFSILVSLSHQSPLNLVNKEYVNQLKSKAKDSIKRKKKVLTSSFKKKRRFGSSRWGKSR